MDPQMLKKYAALLGLLLSPLSYANLFYMDGMTFTVGYWGDSTNRHGLRVAGRWDWDVVWLKQSPIQLTGYWEGGFGYWRADTRNTTENSHLFITSASPILQIWLGPVDLMQNRFFFEFGIGPSYFSDNQLGAKEFGGLWHFEDKFGAGFNFGTTQPTQVIFRYYHYSNLGVIGPNEGLDLFTLGVVWFF
jgi:lipid A 3-O-deacylase